LVIGLKFFQAAASAVVLEFRRQISRYILMYNGSFTCLTMSKVLDSVYLLSFVKSKR
jgi:hypothetical protein